MAVEKNAKVKLKVFIENNIIINDKITINNSVESTYYLSDSGVLLLPIMDNMIKLRNINLFCGREFLEGGS